MITIKMEKELDDEFVSDVSLREYSELAAEKAATGTFGARLDAEFAAVAYAAAAALLEVHDAGGISLEKFGPVGTFVNFMLTDLDLPDYTPNGA